MSAGKINERDIDDVFGDGFRMPEGFAWGVGNSAYQTEEGLNGPGEPQNNWAMWERTGKAVPTRGTTRFLEKYPEDLKNAKEISMTHFRIGLEWARIQPHPENKSALVPTFDDEAIDNYAKLISSIRENGMEPVVTLHHFTHPLWAGEDMWLEQDNLSLFDSYVSKSVTELNEKLISKHHEEPISFWETTNEPNVVPLATYLFGRFPHGRGISLKNYLEATTNQLLAHIIAYERINEIYSERNWTRPLVSLALVSMCIYQLDFLFFDLLLARENGIGRNELQSWISERANEFHAEMGKIPRPSGARFRIGKQIEKALEKAVPQIIKEKRFEPLIEKVYASTHERLADYIGVDFYDPFIGHYAKPPSLEDIRELNFELGIRNWEWVQNPYAFRAFLKKESAMQPGIPVYVFENGISNRVRNGKAIPRKDGWDRPAYLKAFLFELSKSIKEGANVRGYFHWSITDNYEWGSFEPRFGLYGIDYEDGAKRLTGDSEGKDSPGTYKGLVDALTTGSQKDIIRAFS
ncbi:MAG: family 1 glycosylhydrolase [Actinomycetota bacterium]|nr:family 1 glycosylhydrolase [Actinomycetota bacterium]